VCGITLLQRNFGHPTLKNRHSSSRSACKISGFPPQFSLIKKFCVCVFLLSVHHSHTLNNRRPLSFFVFFSFFFLPFSLLWWGFWVKREGDFPKASPLLCLCLSVRISLSEFALEKREQIFCGVFWTMLTLPQKRRSSVVRCKERLQFKEVLFEFTTRTSKTIEILLEWALGGWWRRDGCGSVKHGKKGLGGKKARNPLQKQRLRLPPHQREKTKYCSSDGDWNKERKKRKSNRNNKANLPFSRLFADLGAEKEVHTEHTQSQEFPTFLSMKSHTHALRFYFFGVSDGFWRNVYFW